MSGFNTLLLLVTTFLAVFAESAFDLTRHLLGTQVDFLPPLMVYAGLTGDLVSVGLVAVLGGLWFDALSINPLGASVLPLLGTGFVIHLKRALILRDQFTAQWVLGLIAGAVVPLLSLLVLFSAGRSPLVGWRFWGEWIVGSVAAGFLTPAVFRFFELAHRTFSYRPVAETSFRQDRQIRRGRK